MWFLLSSLVFAGLGVAQNSTNTTSVSLQVAASGGNATSGLQYGLMFEDINHSGDGGIYAELIMNRAFQGDSIFPSTISPWIPIGGASLTLQNTSTPLSSALPVSMNVASSNGSGIVGFANPGYWGIDVQPQTYTGTFYVYGAYSGGFVTSLVSDSTGYTFASANITSNSVYGKWTQHNYTLTPTAAAPDVNNSLAITYDSGRVNGSLNFNFISLFPPTYNDRPNGMRIDLMEALKELSPSFLRMPGGNNLEGNNPPYFWMWNESIGPLIDRPGYPGTWGYENTMGLGLVEYLYWCIDLEMEPILAVWSGLWLDGTTIPEDEIDTYVQYALDELEFIMGPTSSTYGALREQLGYGSDPIYDIKYVEVGNEDNLNGGDGSYYEYRFPAFYNAISTAYPNITIIASTSANALPGNAAGDYHQYTRPDYFVSQFNFFDQNTSAHLSLLGEYATVQPNIAAGGGVDWSLPRSPYPFWIGTVAEAVYLLGAERNADAVLGASYAPLLQNLDGYQWVPDLISYTADTNADVLSTSYHQIALFSKARIASTLPVTTTANFGPAYWVAGTSASSDSSYVLKVAIYNSTSDVPFKVNFLGVKSGQTATLTVLTAPDGYSYNGPGMGDVVVETTSSVVAGGDGTLSFGLPNLSVAVLTV